MNARDELDELHAGAATIPCRDCHAAAGEPCRNKTVKPPTPTKIPHPKRIMDAWEPPF